jgi:hypothetical protein
VDAHQEAKQVEFSEAAELVLPWYPMTVEVPKKPDKGAAGLCDGGGCDSTCLRKQVLRDVSGLSRSEFGHGQACSSGHSRRWKDSGELCHLPPPEGGCFDGGSNTMTSGSGSAGALA